jgi:hypothetical protein
MRLDSKQIICLGLGAFAVVVLICSTKKVVLQEVASEKSSKSFDSSNLPPELKPPYRLAEGEELPKLAKRNYSFNALGLKPRFDL